MKLLRELHQQLKESEITFSRGEVSDAPEQDDQFADGPAPDSELSGDASPEMTGDDPFGSEEDTSVKLDLEALVRALTWATSVEDGDSVHDMAEQLMSLGQENAVSAEDVEEIIQSLSGSSEDEFDDENLDDPEGGEDFSAELDDSEGEDVPPPSSAGGSGQSPFTGAGVA